MTHALPPSFTWLFSQLLCHVFLPNLWDRLNMSLSCCGEITCRTKTVGSAFLAQALPPRQAIQVRSLNLGTVTWCETETEEFFLILRIQIMGSKEVTKVFFSLLPLVFWGSSGISDCSSSELAFAFGVLIEIIGSHTGPQSWIPTGAGSS